MPAHRICFYGCLSLTALCLAAGYVVAAGWTGSVITLITCFAWLAARKHPASGLPAICLIATVCLAVAGLLAGCPRWLMILGAAFGLGTWDLLFLEQALYSSPRNAQTSRHENRHLRSLSGALACGLIVALAGPMLHLEIPFVVMIVCVGLVLWGFERAWAAIGKRNTRIR